MKAGAASAAGGTFLPVHWRAHGALLALCATTVIALHFPLLRLPYYWDEAGYYIPAARDFYQTGDLIPRSTLSNPHPPLLSLYLAGAWKLFGDSPLVTRVAMALVAGASLFALLLVASLLVPAAAGLWAAALTATTPLFFAQSTLAHLDVAATLGTLLSLYFFLRRQTGACVVAGILLCLVRETGAVVVVTLAGLEFARAWRRDRLFSAGARSGLWLMLPLVPLAGWFVFLRWRTGWWLGDPHFAAYNLWDVLRPARWVLQFLKRLYQVAIADFHWVVTILVVLAARRRAPSAAGDRAAGPAPSQSLVRRTLLAVMTTYLVFMSIFGGAPLARYLLPIFPLFFLLAADAAFRLRWRGRQATLVLLPASFVFCWFWNPPYPFAYEDNLAYADFVRLHRDTAPLLERLPAETRVLTAWPASDELSRSWLGYVRRPLAIVAVPEFSREDLGRVSREQFDVLFLFSRQWHPEWYERFPRLAALQIRYFGQRPQVTPEWVRERFGLQRWTRTELRGQWVEIWAKSHILRQPTLSASGKVVGAGSVRRRPGRQFRVPNAGTRGALPYGNQRNLLQRRPAVSLQRLAFHRGQLLYRGPGRRGVREILAIDLPSAPEGKVGGDGERRRAGDVARLDPLLVFVVSDLHPRGHPESNGVLQRYHRSTREALEEADLRNYSQACERIAAWVPRMGRSTFNPEGPYRSVNAKNSHFGSANTHRQRFIKISLWDFPNQEPNLVLPASKRRPI